MSTCIYIYITQTTDISIEMIQLKTQNPAGQSCIGTKLKRYLKSNTATEHINQKMPTEAPGKYLQ